MTDTLNVLRTLRRTLVEGRRSTIDRWREMVTVIYETTEPSLAQLRKLDDYRRDMLIAQAKIVGLDLAIKAIKELNT